MATETKTQPTELFEDNAGGLHLVVGETIYHLPDQCGLGANGTYAEHVEDLSWLSDFKAENPGDFESVTDFDFEWTPRIATSDENGAISHDSKPGSAGRVFLGLPRDED